MKIDTNICNGCGICVANCPLEVIRIVADKAVVGDGCVSCNVCLKICSRNAIIEEVYMAQDVIVCGCCPVGCRIANGRVGACKRFVNENGQLMRTRPLLTYHDVVNEIAPPPESTISSPLITAIGAGGTYPDYIPAPYIVTDKKNEVDVVTVVTEVPLSYSGIKLKIDTDLSVGQEGAAVTFEGRTVGMVETEEYGSKILAIGGVNRLTGKAGFAAARAVVALANREALELKVKGGARLQVQVGRPPDVDGQTVARMRVGCGSAAAGLFATFFAEAADDVIVLDPHITSLFSHHTAGRCLGKSPSGITLTFPESTPGRYFGRHGDGWGNTNIENPLDIISDVDLTRTPPGSTLLVTETTGEKAAMFRLMENGSFQTIELTEAAKAAVDAIAETCQDSRVSAFYVGGAGGSARAGVVKYPLRLTHAVHAGKAVLTCGGAPVFVLPGGGITFYVDIEQVKAGSFAWVPTPATVAPVEYTMKLNDYQEIGGHMEAVKPFLALKPRRFN